MNWGIHRIGTNRTFKKLMDTCGCGIVVIVDSRLGNRRKLTVTLKGLIFLVHHIHGWHTIDAIQLHFCRTNKDLSNWVLIKSRENQNVMMGFEGEEVFAMKTGELGIEMKRVSRKSEE